MTVLDWRLRHVPLTPRAVAGRGAVARRLAQRVVAEPGPWRGVVGDDCLVLVGADLPWVDGVTYLGTAPEAPWLLHDCRYAPFVPLDWLGRWAARRSPGLVALLPEPQVLVPLVDAEVFDPVQLEAWAR